MKNYDFYWYQILQNTSIKSSENFVLKYSDKIIVINVCFLGKIFLWDWNPEVVLIIYWISEFYISFMYDKYLVLLVKVFNVDIDVFADSTFYFV